MSRSRASAGAARRPWPSCSASPVLFSGSPVAARSSEDGTVVAGRRPDAAPNAAPLAKSKGKPTTVDIAQGSGHQAGDPGSEAGDRRPAAVKGKQLTVNYLGITCSNGQEFDSSWGKKGKDKDSPLKFVLGTGKVIKGWDEGLVGMKVNGERRLVIPADLAYGDAGQPPTIGSNDTLVFVVQLTAVEKAPPTTTTTTTTTPKSTTTTTAPKSGSTTTTAAKSGSTTTTKP